MKYDVMDFQSQVLQRSNTIPVLVDFWAEWCAPCRMLTPVLERLADEQEEKWVLAKVNTEEQTDVAMRYGVSGIPNVKLFFEERVVGEFVGALPEYQVRKWLETTLPGKSDKLLYQAEALVNGHRLDEAKEILENLVAAEPENKKAKVLLAKSLLYANPSHAVALLDGIEEPKFSDIIDPVTTLARLFTHAGHPEGLPDGGVKQLYFEAIQETRGQNFDAALEKFIQVIRTDRYYDDDGSRKACIAIFKYIGEEHEITLRHRRDFASALY